MLSEERSGLLVKPSIILSGALSAAERSYPMSEIRGSGLECQVAKAQERPRGATPCPRSGATAGRSSTASEVRAMAERS